MAQEEVIVTKFVADTSELDASLDKAAQGLDQLDAAGKKTEKGASNLSASLGSVSAKSQVMTEANKRAADSLKVVSTETQRTGGFLSKLAKGVTDFAKGARDGFKAAIQEVGGLGGIFRQVGGNIKGSLQGWAGLAKDWKKNLGDVANEVPGLGRAFRLLSNPITAVAAVVGGLLYNFTRLDSVGDAIDKVKAGFSSFLDSLAGNASLTDTIKGIERAVELAERIDALAVRKTLNSVEGTNLRAEAALLARQARNKTLDEEVKINLLRQSNAKLEKAASADQLLAVDEVQNAYDALAGKIVQQNSDISESLKAEILGLEGTGARAQALIAGIATSGLEVDKESLDLYAAALNAKKEGETNLALLQETNANKIDAAQQQADEKAQARRDKASQDAAKAAADAERFAKERATLEGQLAGLLTEIEDDQFRKALSKEEQRLFDIEQQYQKKADAIRKLSASLRALPGADIPDINAREAEGLEINTRAQNADILVEEQKINAERIDATNKRIQTEADLEEEASTKRLERFEEEQKKLAELQQQKEQATLAVLASSAEQAALILGQAAADGALTAEEASKQLLTLALDTIEKLVLLNAINAQTGALAFGFASGNPIAGVIAGIAVSALIKGLFAAAKATIAGAYTGEESIGGPAAFPGEARDTHLRRVHPGERIVTAEKNKKHWNLLHSVHTGDVDGFIESNYVIPRINEYLNSDTGQRMATSVMLAKFYDKGIREDLRSTRQSIDELPEAIAAAMMHTRKRGHRRMFA
jgi:hypothetical protein